MEQELRAIANKAISDKIFPGCSIGYVADSEVHSFSAGKLTYDQGSTVVTGQTLYDTASVTKSYVTGTLALLLIERGELSLDGKVIEYVPEIENDYREQITIWNLLTYSLSYRKNRLPLSDYAKEGVEPLLEALFKSNLGAAPGKAFHYTNTPAYWLGLVVESVAGRRLDDFSRDMFFDPLGMTRTTFQPLGLEKKERIAPTEIEDFRGEVRGEVHDESAYVLQKAGDLPGHAGLFTCASDGAKYIQMLIRKGAYDNGHILEPETVELMHTNQLRSIGESAGLGWELNQPRYMGSKASDQTFGKTGFTGCVVEIDPNKDKGFILLCNHTYPHRVQDREHINKVRAAIADVIFS